MAGSVTLVKHGVAGPRTAVAGTSTKKCKPIPPPPPPPPPPLL